MSRLAGLSGKRTVKAFRRFGYVDDHQTGSHIILYHPERPPLSVPNHRELAPGLVRGLVRRAGIEIEEFLTAIQR